MPIYYSNNSGGGEGHTTYWGRHSNSQLYTTNSGGEGQAHNNMPFSLAVYIWVRTS